METWATDASTKCLWSKLLFQADRQERNETMSLSSLMWSMSSLSSSSSKLVSPKLISKEFQLNRLNPLKCFWILNFHFRSLIWLAWEAYLGLEQLDAKTYSRSEGSLQYFSLDTSTWCSTWYSMWYSTCCNVSGITCTVTTEWQQWNIPVANTVHTGVLLLEPYFVLPSLLRP